MAKRTPPPEPEHGQDISPPQFARHVPQQTRHDTRPLYSLTGQRLGDYDLGTLLGVGGMAEVYWARDRILMRDVAVKVLSSSLAEDDKYVNRFRAEARRVAALRHPHLVPVYHAGEDRVNGQRYLYLVMPLLHESLEDVLQRSGRLSPTEAVRVALQVADGLNAAHRHGLIHRDVKPGNILLDAEGQAALADFGLAREMRHPAGVATQQPWGTPEYMAPEQFHNTAIDQRADIYALGVVLYELLTGKRPFEGGSAYDIAAHALTGSLTPPSTYDAAIPPAIEHVVLTALAREPGDRYPNMATFALALRQAQAVSLRPGNEDAGTEALFTAAITVPLPDHFWSSAHAATPSSIQSAVHGNRQRSLRWVLAFGVAAAVIVASLVGVVSALQHRGQDPHYPSTIQGTAPGGQASQTAVGNPVQGQTPQATLAATNTPHTQSTVATSPTATPAPGSPLSIAPTPLVLTPSATNPKTCIATQTVRNNTASGVGWAWQPPTVGGFHFQVNGGPSVGWPNATTITPPGGQATLVATADCKPQAVSYAILVKDSLGGQYTFVMTLQ
jgi:eukaryotic-like serine/threonine-protein kinase